MPNFTQIAEMMICKLRLILGDVDGDGLPEIVVTYLMEVGVYSSQIYDISCPGNCLISLQALDFSLLSNMSALPFLVDASGSGNISFYTFSSSKRSIVQYYTNSNNTLSL
jgi:hypothetical protein